MSGLEAFSGMPWSAGRRTTAFANCPRGALKLACTNPRSLSGSLGILLDSITSVGATGGGQIVELGVPNTIRSDSGITLGSRKGRCSLSFDSEAFGLGEGGAVFGDSAGCPANWHQK